MSPDRRKSRPARGVAGFRSRHRACWTGARRSPALPPTRAEGRAAALETHGACPASDSHRRSQRPAGARGLRCALQRSDWNARATFLSSGTTTVSYVDMLAPPLTTMRIRQTDIGREAARILIAVTSGGQSRKKRNIRLRTDRRALDRAAAKQELIPQPGGPPFIRSISAYRPSPPALKSTPQRGTREGSAARGLREKYGWFRDFASWRWMLYAPLRGARGISPISPMSSSSNRNGDPLR